MGQVVVTGAGHGIGAALGRRYARAGHSVALLDIDAEAASAVAGQINEAGGTALALGCDITIPGEVRDAVACVIDAWGGFDTLVNNAGLTHMGGVCETDVQVLQRVMEVNFFGAVHCTQAALPALLERKGCVAVLSSVAGFAPLAMRAGYVASKHALQGFFGTLRAEHTANGLAVTIVCPSFVETDIGRRALTTDGRSLGSGARPGVAHTIGPDAAAEKIFRGIDGRRRVVFVGQEARLASLLIRLAPRVYEHFMIRRTLATECGVSAT